jgi:surface protein
LLKIEQGSNKSLFTLIAVVIFGVFLSLSYWMFQDEMKNVLASVMDGVEEVTGVKISNTLSGTPIVVSPAPDEPDTPVVPIVPETHEEWVAKRIAEGYVLAKDSDFKKTNGVFIYIGTDTHVIVPHVIAGVPIVTYTSMFYSTSVLGVASDNKNVTDMSRMFQYSVAPTLDVSHLDTSSVTNMLSMFWSAKASTLDLSNFNTSNVTNMKSMFHSTEASTINVSSFDTSKVINMYQLFQYSKVNLLDLSSFDLTHVTEMGEMFYYVNAKVGYARTQAEATRFNNTSYRPNTLNFTVKP